MIILGRLGIGTDDDSPAATTTVESYQGGYVSSDEDYDERLVDRSLYGLPLSGSVTCDNFTSSADAQAYFTGVLHPEGNLDADHDGLACEDFP